MFCTPMTPFVFSVFFSHIFPTKIVTKYWKALKQKGILALNLRLPKFKTEKKSKKQHVRDISGTHANIYYGGELYNNNQRLKVVKYWCKGPHFRYLLESWIHLCISHQNMNLISNLFSGISTIFSKQVVFKIVHLNSTEEKITQKRFARIF